MAVVLDAYAVIALLRGEPAADDVRRLLEDSEEAALTLPGVAEVVDFLMRRAGVDEETAVADVAELTGDGPLSMIESIAMRAGLLRARHYHRRTRAISLTDCVAAETARYLDGAVATSDPHLLDTCLDEGIDVVALPDTNGAMWEPGE